ncbi:MAG: type II toxin-antitoxin system prevent-host-death family antitoxin [Chloroflexi bacterium]|nr:MAG: type II toxin-antitoxin system prevent-host-death family antitoxin [Chloroflexota bacterium]
MEKSASGIKRRAFQLREKGFTYALIEKQLGIPYAEAKKLGHEYDARHGKPRKVVRTLAPESTGSGPITIPVRELRNDSAGILRQVEAGRSFLITVAGREVAALGPVAARGRFASKSALEAILREAPLDDQFMRDINDVLGERIDQL